MNRYRSTARDGRLATAGLTPRKLLTLSTALEERREHDGWLPFADREPDVADLLAVDAAFREQVRRHREAGGDESWLPPFRLERDGWRCRARFARTALTARIGTTHDWVEVHFEGRDKSGQRTVVSLNAKGFDQEAMVKFLPEMQVIDVVVVDAHYPALVDSVLSEVSDQRVSVVIDPGSYKPHVFDLMAKCDHVIASRSLDPTVEAAALLERIAEHGTALAAVSAGSQSILTAIGDRRSGNATKLIRRENRAAALMSEGLSS